jgi:SNF2 family DNA or RNA helicase
LLPCFSVIKGGTLIICPSSLINQWINEIKSKLSPRLLDFVQHYGPNRESSPRRLSRKDVVITTYHVVMWDHKSHQHTVCEILVALKTINKCVSHIFLESTISNKMETHNS